MQDSLKCCIQLLCQAREIYTFVHRFRTSKKRTVIKVWLFGVRASIRKSIKLLVNFKLYFIGSTCVRATYTDLGNKIGVFNEQVNSM